jgi:2-keto-4-pentenoate hydratase/2-oxohepta-3-ene-1,7-dioic acid hydratase in catechol pathway
MRRARILTPDGPVAGQYEDGTVHADDGSYEVGVDGRLLPPCEPTALYCIGRNYAETLEQMEYERPAEPTFFIKPPTSLVGHGETVRYPEFTEEFTYAGELAAVVDERCRDVDEAAVPDVIRGYTIMNDLDALDQPNLPARKAFDGSAPLGPWLERDLDPTELDMHTEINGERRQDATTNLMLFDVYEIVSYLSKRFTLRPGDVVAFGSPANPGLLEPSDEIEITYDGIGTLRNTIADSP